MLASVAAALAAAAALGARRDPLLALPAHGPTAARRAMALERDDRRQVASVLGEPEDRILVELVPSGGAFGGKEDMSVQAQAALLARLTGRPVRITLDREQSIRMHPKRHPMTMTYTVGCDASGRGAAVVSWTVAVPVGPYTWRLTTWLPAGTS